MLFKKITTSLLVVAIGGSLTMGSVSAFSPIQKGDRSEDVVALQEELASEGLYDYTIDGIFGSITYDGVKDLQKNNGFSVDGIVGKQTIEALDSFEVSKASEPSNKKSSDEVSGTMTVEATYYTATCKGCIGITNQGTDVRSTIRHSSGHRIVAVDPNVIPLGTVVEINGETFIADDTGSAIKNKRIDILVSTKEEARKLGRHDVEVKILD